MSVNPVLSGMVVAYVIGSLPTAYIIGRLNRVNIFTVGSGNMGAGNIARALGKPWGAITWFLDSIKGIAAILVVRAMFPVEYQPIATMLGAIVAIIGHNWSIFVVFITGHLRGGKGAATAIGTWFLFIPPALILIVMSIWVLIVITTRYVSLAVLTTTALIGLVILLLVATGYYDKIYITYLIVTTIVFLRHRENILALLAGRERRLGEKA